MNNQDLAIEIYKRLLEVKINASMASVPVIEEVLNEERERKLMTDKFDLMTPNLHGEEVARLRAEIADLRAALTQANELYNSVEAMNLQLTERIEYAQAGDLVTIPRSIVMAMAAKMKEQTDRIEKLSKSLRSMLYIFDRGLEDGTIGRATCDNAKDALEVMP